MSNSPNPLPTRAISSLKLDDDEDDAFADDEEDINSPAFTREVVRKELERHLPPPIEASWEEASEHNTDSTTGAFFHEANESVSTLDINGNGNGLPYNREGEWVSPTLESPPSAHFSSIPISSDKTEVHSDREDSVTRPDSPNGAISNPESEQEQEQEVEIHPYPAVVIDAPSHRVTLTSEMKPRRASEDIQSLTPRVDANGPLSAGAASPASFAAAQSASMPSVVVSIPGPSTNLNNGQTFSPSSSVPNSTPGNLLYEKPKTHKASRSGAGPSMFEKVRSKTRPVFLPPKSRQEDDKHMADWQQMMKQSRLAGKCICSQRHLRFSSLGPAEKRRKALQDRRALREKAIEDTLEIWEKEIVPDWRVVFKNPQLRRLWWKGIPSKLRALLWEKAVGNQLALSKGTCLWLLYKHLLIHNFQIIIEPAYLERRGRCHQAYFRRIFLGCSRRTSGQRCQHFTFSTMKPVRCMVI